MFRCARHMVPMTAGSSLVHRLAQLFKAVLPHGLIDVDVIALRLHLQH